MSLFVIGEEVRLNSGGPAMKVTNYVKRGIVCEWENGGKHFRYIFPAACVTPLTRPKPRVKHVAAS